ncbi:hypothetical protein GS539_13000 [Rhodococcus hoagii]|nr:hypothetical protein [Prescottella equi]
MGLGTWPLVGAEATEAVLAGIDAGYRQIGHGLDLRQRGRRRRALAQSGVPRGDLFVTTKLRGNDQVSGDIRGALEASLDRLGLERLDLYLIHWPLPRIDPLRRDVRGHAVLPRRRPGAVRRSLQLPRAPLAPRRRGDGGGPGGEPDPDGPVAHPDKGAGGERRTCVLTSRGARSDARTCSATRSCSISRDGSDALRRR